MTKRFRIMFLFAALAASLAAQQEYDLLPGDLLFQDLDCGPLCDAIEAVTKGVEGKDFSHVGMIVKAGDSLAVIEAIGEKVSLLGTAEFFARSPKIAIGRPKEKWQAIIPMATAYAKSMVGVPYDDAFLPENGRLYCSELLEQAWQAANGGEPFFKTPLMTFKDPNTGEFFPAWVDYFKKLGMEIPEGIPGCNPGGLSRDEKIKIIWLDSGL